MLVAQGEVGLEAAENELGVVVPGEAGGVGLALAAEAKVGDEGLVAGRECGPVVAGGRGEAGLEVLNGDAGDLVREGGAGDDETAQVPDGLGGAGALHVGEPAGEAGHPAGGVVGDVLVEQAVEQGGLEAAAAAAPVVGVEDVADVVGGLIEGGKEAGVVYGRPVAGEGGGVVRLRAIGVGIDKLARAHEIGHEAFLDGFGAGGVLGDLGGDLFLALEELLQVVGAAAGLEARCEGVDDADVDAELAADDGEHGGAGLVGDGDEVLDLELAGADDEPLVVPLADEVGGEGARDAGEDFVGVPGGVVVVALVDGAVPAAKRFLQVGHGPSPAPAARTIADSTGRAG